ECDRRRLLRCGLLSRFLELAKIVDPAEFSAGSCQRIGFSNLDTARAPDSVFDSGSEFLAAGLSIRHRSCCTTFDFDGEFIKPVRPGNLQLKMRRQRVNL